MNFDNKLQYFQYLQKDIIFNSRDEDEPSMEEEIFVQNMLDFLTESNFLEEPQFCMHQGRGFKVNAYDLNAPKNAIDIIIAVYKSGEDEIPSITKTEVNNAFKRGRTFLEKSRVGSGFYQSLEDSVTARDLAKTINENYTNLKSSRIILITNGICGPKEGVQDDLDGFKVSYQLWDFERMWRQFSSGMKKEYITVDFQKEGYPSVKCVSEKDGTGLYTTYIGIVTGHMLKDLYDRYGTRLLERNVRAFLQARSKVNRGIRDTIIERPNMFLAYNNGITVTAKKVEIYEDESGGIHITRISDFQDVNGGQTVASLWHTAVKNKASLKNVTLQMKLSIINKEDAIDSIAKKISEYSNAQNKVNTADFSANDPFHMKLEEVSKKIYAPDPTGGNLQTIWFYERARGTFQETRQRELTPARIKAWDRIYPRRQMFDKLVIAKLENTWRLLPHIVSLGGQKNFAHFTIYIKEMVELGKEVEINNSYFKDLISKRIIWKNTEMIVSRQGIPGYRANIVTYTLSWMLKNIPESIDLKKIWEKQEIDEDLTSKIYIISMNVRNYITNTQGNVTEYCKKEDLWRTVRKKKIDLTQDIESIKNANDSSPTKEIKEPKFEDYMEDFVNLALWKKIVVWMDGNGSIPLKDIDFSKNIIKAIEKNGAPTFPQMKVAFKILKYCREKGFDG